MSAGWLDECVRLRDGVAFVRIPLAQVHAVRVALRCPCGAVKSATTEAVRDGLDRALGSVQPGVHDG